MMSSFHNYHTPFEDRYNNEELNRIWSKRYKITTMVDIWIYGHNRLVTMIENKKSHRINWLPGLDDNAWAELLDRIEKEEQKTKHETVAILNVIKSLNRHPSLYHVAMTSSDVQDQVSLIQMMESIIIIGSMLESIIARIINSTKAGKYDQFLVGRTHLRPAEPVTLIHRIELFLEELKNWHELTYTYLLPRMASYLGIMGGSVGTSNNLFIIREALKVEDSALPFPTNKPKSQTLPRSIDLQIGQSLTLLSSALHKFALDFRLESGYTGLVENEAVHRIGSSAMPYKRNPITAEKVCSLSRLVKSLSDVAFDNASHQMLERSLDDSANTRIWLPQAFLAMAECLKSTKILVEDIEGMQETDPESWYDTWQQSSQRTLEQIKQYYLSQNQKFECQDLNYSILALRWDSTQSFVRILSTTLPYIKSFSTSQILWSEIDNSPKFVTEI